MAQEGQQLDAKQLYALQMQAWAHVQGGGPQPEKKQRLEPAPAAVSTKPIIQFGVRGDTLMQTMCETKGKYAKKYKTFKPEFDNEFWNAFGDCFVDYTVDGFFTQDVITSIKDGPSFDVLCVGITCSELFGAWEESSKTHSKIVMSYPEALDVAMQELAAAILSKSKASMVLCGGPSQIWDYPPRWDVFVERASNTLRRAGVQVVPRDTATAVLERMELAEDCVHFAHSETHKLFFVQAWKDWLLIAAQDAQFGRSISTVPEESAVVVRPYMTNKTATASREGQARSRSPTRRAPGGAQPVGGFFFPGAAQPSQSHTPSSSGGSWAGW